MARQLLGLNSSSEDLPDNVYVSMDFVAVIAAFLCAIICVLGLFAMVRCARLRRFTTSTSSSTTTTTHSSAANKGLNKKTLDALPKFTFSHSAATETGFRLDECPICLTEFVQGNEVRVLPDCGHGFHVACIDAWLTSKSSCPSCRQCLVPLRCQKCGHSSAGRKPVDEATFLP